MHIHALVEAGGESVFTMGDIPKPAVVEVSEAPATEAVDRHGPPPAPPSTTAPAGMRACTFLCGLYLLFKWRLSVWLVVKKGVSE